MERFFLKYHNSFTFYCAGKTDGARVDVKDDWGRYGSNAGDDGYLDDELIRQVLRSVAEFETFEGSRVKNSYLVI